MDDIVAGVFDQILEGNHASVDTQFVQYIELNVGDNERSCLMMLSAAIPSLAKK